MAESICNICGEPWWPQESKTNWMVGQAAQLPGVGPLVWRAIWPTITGNYCGTCGGQLAFHANEVGADWVLSCQSGHVNYQAEHKPWGTPLQWSRAIVADYKRAVNEKLIVPDIHWQYNFAQWHEQPHARTAKCGRCEGIKVQGRYSGMFRLTIPQVIRYQLDNNVPCTLVTDRGSATQIYVNDYDDVRGDFVIAAAGVPVRTTPAVLNSLGGLLRHRSMSRDQSRVIQEVVTRLWRRLQWAEVRSLYAPSRALVKPVAYHCAMNHP
jgi:hypothetical protein